MALLTSIRNIELSLHHVYYTHQGLSSNLLNKICEHYIQTNTVIQNEIFIRNYWMCTCYFCWLTSCFVYFVLRLMYINCYTLVSILIENSQNQQQTNKISCAIKSNKIYKQSNWCES